LPPPPTDVPPIHLSGSTADEKVGDGEEDKDEKNDDDGNDDEKQQDEEQGTLLPLELTLTCPLAGAAPTPCMLLLCCLPYVPPPCSTT
jgi:hypothetical protein